MLFLLGQSQPRTRPPLAPLLLRSLPGHFHKHSAPLLAINAPLGSVCSAGTHLKSANSFNMVRVFCCCCCCCVHSGDAHSLNLAVTPGSRRLPPPHPHMAQFKVHDMRGDLTPRGQRAVCACAQEREEGEFAFGGGRNKWKDGAECSGIKCTHGTNRRESPNVVKTRRSSAPLHVFQIRAHDCISAVSWN